MRNLLRTISTGYAFPGENGLTRLIMDSGGAVDFFDSGSVVFYDGFGKELTRYMRSEFESQPQTAQQCLDTLKRFLIMGPHGIVMDGLRDPKTGVFRCRCVLPAHEGQTEPIRCALEPGHSGDHKNGITAWGYLQETDAPETAPEII